MRNAPRRKGTFSSEVAGRFFGVGTSALALPRNSPRLPFVCCAINKRKAANWGRCFVNNGCGPFLFSSVAAVSPLHPDTVSSSVPSSAGADAGSRLLIPKIGTSVRVLRTREFLGLPIAGSVVSTSLSFHDPTDSFAFSR